MPGSVNSGCLTDKMRAHAARCPAVRPEFEQLADRLEKAVADALREPSDETAARIVGAWARARAAWCRETGEPLL